jgi:hypothetical protein
MITELLRKLHDEILTNKPDMKNLIRLFSVLFAAGFIFTACEGPMGPPGKNANDVCITCHTTMNMDAKQAEYHLSKHFLGTSSARNTKYCARCHTSEGFQEITADGQFVVAAEIPNATRITCVTCHKHRAFDFSGDTVSMILRTTTPIALNYNNNATTTDFGTIDNLCVTCHQIRGATSVNYTDAAGKVQKFTQLPFFPLDNSKENTTVKYQVGQSFAVHDGNQSNLFSGINAYEYAGKAYTRTWKHSTNTCTDCHMNEYNPDTKTGGHSLIVNKDACTTCHNGEDKLTPIQTAIDAKRIELAELLVARKVFKKSTNSSGVVSYSAEPSHDFYGVLFPTTQSATIFATALVSANTVGPTSGILVYANTVTLATDADYTNRIGREWKYGELGAAYNYGYITSELSLGVHNPTYAMQVLQNSIDWLKAN